MEQIRIMKTYKKYWLVALIVIGIQTQLGYAQYAEDALRFSQFGSSIGARSQGMGNTVVGIADDFTALFGNPAGLSQQKSYEFSAGLSRLGFNNDVTFFGKKLTDNNNAINLNNLGIVYPIATIRGGLTFAFGFGRMTNYTSIVSFDGYNPSNSIIESLTPNDNMYGWPSDARDAVAHDNIPYQLYLANMDSIGLYPLVTDSVQQNGKILESGGLNYWSFGGAIDIAKNLSIGVTLNFASGSYTRDQRYTESDSKNVYHYAPPYDFDQFTDESVIKRDLSGFNGLIGMMFRQAGKSRVGFTVRTPTTYEISETYNDDAQSQFKPDPSSGAIDKYNISLSKSKNFKLTTPIVISSGISVQPLDWFLLAGDAEYTDWTQMEFDSDNFSLARQNRDIKNLFQDTWNLRCGAEFTIWDLGLKLRTGIEWKQSPYKNAQNSYDNWSYTTGIGVILDENSIINASFLMGTWEAHQYNYSIGDTPASRTKESVNTQVINITFSHRF